VVVVVDEEPSGAGASAVVVSCLVELTVEEAIAVGVEAMRRTSTSLPEIGKAGWWTRTDGEQARFVISKLSLSELRHGCMIITEIRPG
jgi:hypothetical protein